ncbi:hypothetical protein B0H67DRAFT_595068 [Lasiosphaeris hirsuta]|uniref:N-acetyltransferase domain-containing protein n=1 Tax=Lasiosphaeris hirsuta TaxID=260670 RepID=A0AA39ZSN9_9PEZI|nr:hypothetical protein B0H67DRAFT_595068 [Lasiosphaeris hirsuta]
MNTTRFYTRVAFPTAQIVRLTDEVAISKCVLTIASAFDRVPCTNAFSAEAGQTVFNYVDKTIRSSITKNGILVKAADASAVALWELPFVQEVDTIPTSDAYRNVSNDKANSNGPIKSEWKEVVQRAKMKYIGTKKNSETNGLAILPHFHLDFLARNPAGIKVPGAITAVVRPYLTRAKQDRLSVWLEATSLDVVTLYQHFGFRLLEEITVGVGTVNGQGTMKKSGEGVKAWLMIMENDVSSDMGVEWHCDQ